MKISKRIWMLCNFNMIFQGKIIATKLFRVSYNYRAVQISQNKILRDFNFSKFTVGEFSDREIFLIFASLLVLISVSLFFSAEPVYLNSDTTLNSTFVSGNSTLGAYVINSSNIVVNLNGSTYPTAYNLLRWGSNWVASGDNPGVFIIKQGTAQHHNPDWCDCSVRI